VKKKTKQLLSKASEAIQAAELLFEGELFDFAAGRAYYAMFYAAEALLFERGLEFSKHSGVHAAFGKHFAKSGEMNAKYHRYLLEAFESRLEADYGVEIDIGSDAVRELIERAIEFQNAVQSDLKAREEG